MSLGMFSEFHSMSTLESMFRQILLSSSVNKIVVTFVNDNKNCANVDKSGLSLPFDKKTFVNYKKLRIPTYLCAITLYYIKINK